MFVDSINIREFRGIKGCKKPLEFSKLNILIGRNNAGKTSVLEALSLLPQPKSSDPITGPKSKIELLTSLHDSKPNNYESLLYFYTGKSKIEYYVNNQEFSIFLSRGRPELHIGETKITDDRELFDIFGKKKLTNLVIYIPFDSNFLKDMEKRLEGLKHQINKEGLNVKLATTINKCLDDKYSEIMFQDKIILRKVLGDNKFNYVNLRDLGTGAKKVIKIMAIVEVLKPKLLLIDDFEAGLHPSLIDIFLNWLNDKKLQTIVSTHSIDVLYRLTEIDP
ncbi:hypothetical protein LCGC14_1020090, partial [marine sediment metagenome]